MGTKINIICECGNTIITEVWDVKIIQKEINCHVKTCIQCND